MKTKHLVIIALLSSGPAFAGTTRDYVDFTDFLPAMANAQAPAEPQTAPPAAMPQQSKSMASDDADAGPRGVAGARHSIRGSSPVSRNTEVVDFSDFKSTKTRAQVRQELMESYK